MAQIILDKEDYDSILDRLESLEEEIFKEKEEVYDEIDNDMLSKDEL